MHPILVKLLNQRGITRSELSEAPPLPGYPSEKEDFDKWDKALTNEKVTIEDVANFCQQEIHKIEHQWGNFDNLEKKNERLIIAHTVYSAILKMINSPKVELVSLIQYLEQYIQ